MLFRLDDVGDDEVLQLVGGVVDMLDLEADAREGLDDLGERRRRLQLETRQLGLNVIQN